MKTFLAIAVLAACQFATAQKTQELKDLKRITVGSDMKLTLVKGTENKLVFEGNEEETDVDYKDGSLQINGGGNATVYYKNELESITAGSDAHVTGSDEIKGRSFTLTAGSDSEVQLNLNVKDLTVAAGSDASITLRGKADKTQVAAGSDAQFNGKGLSVADANVTLGSDAEGSITAKGTVNATVTSDAQLTIYGNPKKVNESKSGDAEIIIAK
jgi:Putative auto-transporter adhesin, head GIN domain